MASGIKDKVAILGMGCSHFGERWDANAEGPLRSFPSLAVQPAQEEGPQEGPIEVE